MIFLTCPMHITWSLWSLKVITTTNSGRIAKRIIRILQIIGMMNPDYLKHTLDSMYDYVHIIYASIKNLDNPPVIICLSCHPGILSACLICFRILYVPHHHMFTRSSYFVCLAYNLQHKNPYTYMNGQKSRALFPLPLDWLIRLCPNEVKIELKAHITYFTCADQQFFSPSLYLSYFYLYTFMYSITTITNVKNMFGLILVLKSIFQSVCAYNMPKINGSNSNGRALLSLGC